MRNKKEEQMERWRAEVPYQRSDGMLLSGVSSNVTPPVRLSSSARGS